MAETLRVASYNLRDFKDDLRAAERVVRAIRPDVLLVQEAPRAPFSAHRVAGFAERCTLMWSGGSWRASGGTTVMACSRVDVLDMRHIALPVPPGQRVRGYAGASVRLAGHAPVRVVSIHLPLDPVERERHARIVLDAAGPGRVVVGGDLNETADGRAWQLLADRLSVLTGPADTFPARGPNRRIDVVLAGAGLRAAATRRDEPALDPADLVAASDHLPVWVDIELSAAP